MGRSLVHARLNDAVAAAADRRAAEAIAGTYAGYGLPELSPVAPAANSAATGTGT